MLDYIYHSLDPIAFSIGPIDVRWYGLAYLIGFISVGIVIYRTARRWNLRLSIDDVLFLVIAIAFGVIFGARFFYVLFYNLPYYMEHPAHILFFNEGGMSFHGGLFGACLFGFIACRSLRLPFGTMCDLVAIGAPIGLFCGRIANFINGELWGSPTDVAWAVTFESGGGIPRHPSQLYEAFLEGFVIFVVLYSLSYRKPPFPRWTYLGLFLALYALFRSCIEFVRVPDAQLGYLFGFVTMGQLLCVPVAIAGIYLLVHAHRSQTPQQESFDQRVPS